MKKTYFSKRIYKSELSCDCIAAITESIRLFNRAKHFAFQTLVREARLHKKLFSKSLHLVLKDKYGMSDYYRNSICREANALFTSQMELCKLYVKQTEEKIKHLKKKITKERKFLTQFINIKQSFIKGKLQLPRNLRFSVHEKGVVSYTYKKETRIWWNTYLFEHQYITPMIKQTKAKIGRLSHRLYRLQQKQEKQKQETKSVVFGTKKLFKKQHTKKKSLKNHEEWKEIFRLQRNKQMILSGRKDAKFGNFVFHYDVEMKNLQFKDIQSRVHQFGHVVFPYGQEVVDEAISTQKNCENKKVYGKPITWSVEEYGTYYIVKCVIDISPNPYVNVSMSGGVIGVDCNVNHYAWTNVSRDGNYLGSGIFSFSIHRSTSNQISKRIEAEAIGLVNLAFKYKKPLVVEQLNTTLSKTGDKYNNKKVNQLKSLFAYQKMISALQSRADKMGVEVMTVHPAYTSISGKMKYMKRLGISIHQSAAFTIGRRGLGYQEKIPTNLKPYVTNQQEHHWKQWQVLQKVFNIRTHLFYKLFMGKQMDPNEMSISEWNLLKKLS